MHQTLSHRVEPREDYTLSGTCHFLKNMIIRGHCCVYLLGMPTG